MQELRKEVQRSSSRQRLSGFSYHSSEVQDLDLCKIELTGGGQVVEWALGLILQKLGPLGSFLSMGTLFKARF